MRGIATAIKEGDTTLEQAFSVPTKSNALGKASKSLSVPEEEEVVVKELIVNDSMPEVIEMPDDLEALGGTLFDSK